MNYAIFDADTCEVVADISYPPDFNTGQQIAQRNLVVNEGELTMNYEQQWFNGIMLNFGNFVPGKERRLIARMDTPVIEMRFALQGDTNVRIGEHQACFSSGYHQIFYSGEPDIEYSRNKSATVFEVSLTEHYFERLVSEDCEPMVRMAEFMVKKEFAFIGQELMITPAMYLTIQDIRNSKRRDGLSRIYLESRVLDLLMLQIGQLQQSLKPAWLTRLKAYDIEKIYYAREILERHISKPCSLINLAHQAGINDFKLKQGFKEIFGTTVFGFLHDKRMSDARKMLLDSGCSLGEVAFYCGFEHVKNFSSAFKKYWGVTPAQLRT